jgi:CRP-like cAMP-binding protein
MATTTNRLLAAVAEPERARVLARSVALDLARDEVLYEPGEPIRFVFFPETCVVSLLQPFASGVAVETATIGCEGMVWVGILLSERENATLRTLAQIGGRALRVSRADALGLVSELLGFRSAVLGFAASLLETAMLSVACNRVHDVRARLARWLLMTHDRCAGNVLPLTHDTLSEMLGVHRPTVTHALSSLRRAGLVESSRAEIVIRDRPGLEAAACECYRLAPPSMSC